MDPTAQGRCDAKHESIKKLEERVHTLTVYVNCLEQTSLQEEKALHFDTSVSKALVKLMHMNFKAKTKRMEFWNRGIRFTDCVSYSMSTSGTCECAASSVLNRMQPFRRVL